MIHVTSELLRIDQQQPKMSEYPSGIKKLLVKGNSSKVVPVQNLTIITRTFTTNPEQFINSSDYDITFREF